MPVWAIVALLAVAGGFTVCAVKIVRTLAGASRRRRRGTTTTAVVVAIEERGEMAGEGMFTVRIPTLEFRDAAGRPRRFRSPEPVPDCPPVGGGLPVWYDPADPSAPAELTVGSLRGAIGLYTAGMVVCVLLGSFMLWFSTLFRS